MSPEGGDDRREPQPPGPDEAGAPPREAADAATCILERMVVVPGHLANMTTEQVDRIMLGTVTGRAVGRVVSLGAAAPGRVIGMTRRFGGGSAQVSGEADPDPADNDGGSELPAS
ncbi:MAG TPA: hypothetical protein VHA37_09640 [Candidatus Saccharimonadales bacterium]|nr:hypothetical protein [Candidatus Saccharimonadales bacterium]